jgi:hypothetical protein
MCVLREDRPARPRSGPCLSERGRKFNVAVPEAELGQERNVSAVGAVALARGATRLSPAQST